MRRSKIKKKLEGQGATVTPVGRYGHLRVEYNGRMAVISTWWSPSINAVRRWHLRRLGLEL